MQQPKWHRSLEKIQVNNKYHAWLAKPRSVSSAMKKLCGTLQVQLLEQKINLMNNDEADYLAVENHQGLIRQVFLQADGEYWSYGRVVVPMITYQQYQDTFDSLGDSLIGETWLYKEHGIKRSAFEYAKLERMDNMITEINRWYTEHCKRDKVDTIYARRSIFTLNSYKILVMEGYLPDIPKLK